MPEYRVNLALRVEAESPDKAAMAMIGHLIENGLTSWAYQVVDPDTEESLGVFDGYGLEVPLEEEQDTTQGAEQTPVQTEGTGEQESTPEESDAALLSLAAELNESDQPAPEPSEPTAE